jgi:mannose-6-phosphate isomerase-like protein (cupin superfamily)
VEIVLSVVQNRRVQSARLPSERDGVAPDGSDVRVLVGGGGGSMAHFTLGPGDTSVAVAHRTLEELWYFTGGRGQMWRHTESSGHTECVDVAAGAAVSIPPRTHFQFRAIGPDPLRAVAVTMPPWPGIGDMTGRGEVYFVEGPWEATVQPGIDPELAT